MAITCCIPSRIIFW